MKTNFLWWNQGFLNKGVTRVINCRNLSVNMFLFQEKIINSAFEQQNEVKCDSFKWWIFLYCAKMLPGKKIPLKVEKEQQGFQKRRLPFGIMTASFVKWTHYPFIPCWPCSGPDTRTWHVCSPQWQSRSCPQRRRHLSPYWTPCWRPRLHLSVRRHNNACPTQNPRWALKETGIFGANLYIYIFRWVNDSNSPKGS